jgi:hypothetical protein
MVDYFKDPTKGNNISEYSESIFIGRGHESSPSYDGEGVMVSKLEVELQTLAKVEEVGQKVMYRRKSKAGTSSDKSPSANMIHDREGPIPIGGSGLNGLRNNGIIKNHPNSEGTSNKGFRIGFQNTLFMPLFSKRRVVF